MKSIYYILGYILGTIFISIVIKQWLAPQEMSIVEILMRIWQGGIDEGGGLELIFFLSIKSANRSVW